MKIAIPIPAIDEMLDELYGTNWFSKLDLVKVTIKSERIQVISTKQPFVLIKGIINFWLYRLGCVIRPSSFQANMNMIFQPHLRKFVIAFFDDILVYSSTMDDHISHLELVFACLLQHQFYLKKFKCIIALQSLLHKVCQELDFYCPTLTELFKKDAFLWSPTTQDAFDQLKVAIIAALVLSLPNFEEDFVIETDASGVGMGPVLIQKGHPTCYFNKKFCQKLLNSSTYVRQLCTIITTVKKWRTYLLGRKFTIYTNHKSLRELMKQVIRTLEQ